MSLVREGLNLVNCYVSCLLRTLSETTEKNKIIVRNMTEEVRKQKKWKNFHLKLAFQYFFELFVETVKSMSIFGLSALKKTH